MKKIVIIFSLLFVIFTSYEKAYSFQSLKKVIDSDIKAHDLKIKELPKVDSTAKHLQFSSSEFSNPLSYMYVTSSFGSRKHPIANKVLAHGGVDFRAASGTKVMASSSGIVQYAGKSGNYGNLVIINHKNGFETRYAHLSKINVKPGQKVEVGQAIALSGNTGRSTGPHLHFKLRKNGRVLNPLNYLA